MDPNKLVDLQIQMSRNQEDLKDYLQEIDKWEDEIKLKEKQLMSKQSDNQSSSLPPIRNSLTKKVLKKKKKQKKSEDVEKKPRKIRGYDYRSWDKFDVEKACAEVDTKEKESSSEYETDEEMEEVRKKQVANNFREQGNELFKKQKFIEATECYSKGLELDSENILLLLNRAMALLKQDKYGAAENDCTRAILLGTKDMKAWFRRGTAREALNRYEEALKDFEDVVVLDPNNRAAHAKIDAIKNILYPKPASNIVKAVYLPPEKRSKKPLRKIPIEEIGVVNEKSTDCGSAAKIVETTDFERFLENSSKTQSITEQPTKRLIEEIPETASAADEQTETEDAKLLHLTTNKLPQKSDQCKEYSSKTTSEIKTLTKTSADCPPVPKSAVEFQTCWKAVKKQSHKFFNYLKQIDPKDYRHLFSVDFNDELFTIILSTLKEYYIREGLDIFAVLFHLTKVSQFSLTNLFLSSEYKQVLRDLFAHVEMTGKYTPAQVSDLKMLYEL